MISRYSLGCAFTVSDLLYNFNYKRLKINCKQCKEIIGDQHRDKLAIKIFKTSFQLVIKDVIENNITFWLPLIGNKKCNIHMRRVQGDEFKNLRKAGKWKDIDILKSMFSGYEIGFYMLGNRTPRVKTIYVNNILKSQIVSNINKGISYGDSNNERTLKDYLEQIYSMFPQVPQIDIDKILKFSWRSIYIHNSYGGDVLIQGKGIWYYIGKLKKNPLDHFHYYIKKLTVKLRVLYRRKKIEWNGYYYFALSESQFQTYQSQINKKGRPKKYYNYGNVYLYQILDECKINEYYKKYIFRIPIISRLKIKQYTKELITDKAELIITREPLKFKDILVYDNEYEFI